MANQKKIYNTYEIINTWEQAKEGMLNGEVWYDSTRRVFCKESGGMLCKLLDNGAWDGTHQINAECSYEFKKSFWVKANVVENAELPRLDKLYKDIHNDTHNICRIDRISEKELIIHNAGYELTIEGLKVFWDEWEEVDVPDVKISEVKK